MIVEIFLKSISSIKLTFCLEMIRRVIGWNRAWPDPFWILYMIDISWSLLFETAQAKSRLHAQDRMLCRHTSGRVELTVTRYKLLVNKQQKVALSISWTWYCMGTAPLLPAITFTWVGQLTMFGNPKNWKSAPLLYAAQISLLSSHLLRQRKSLESWNLFIALT